MNTPGPRFDPSQRMLLLSQLVDELPDDETAAIIRAVSFACFSVVRHLRGTGTEAEARFAIERAREALKTRRDAPASARANRYSSSRSSLAK